MLSSDGIYADTTDNTGANRIARNDYNSIQVVLIGQQHIGIYISILLQVQKITITVNQLLVHLLVMFGTVLHV